MAEVLLANKAQAAVLLALALLVFKVQSVEVQAIRLHCARRCQQAQGVDLELGVGAALTAKNADARILVAEREQRQRAQGEHAQLA